ncbi:hypothetical protein GBA52_026467 [Prunus armeniaca]|nr:hypothetical protein GBA52_026467 [Prunus armeniaca]
MDDLADQFGIGTLRLTTTQTFQIHGVLKKDLKTVMSSCAAMFSAVCCAKRRSKNISVKITTGAKG